MFCGQDIGIRTKKVVDMVAEEILKLDASVTDAEKKAAVALKNAGIKINDKKMKAMPFCL